MIVDPNIEYETLFNKESELELKSKKHRPSVTKYILIEFVKYSILSLAVQENPKDSFNNKYSFIGLCSCGTGHIDFSKFI
jgi:hypothetical protein